MIKKEREGYDAYFAGAKYAATGKCRHWHNGFVAAERQSRCGWRHEDGSPNRLRNKS